MIADDEIVSALSKLIVTQDMNDDEHSTTVFDYELDHLEKGQQSDLDENCRL